MKKTIFLFVLIFAMSISVFALDNTRHSVVLTYDDTNKNIDASISVSAGDAIVGHFGLKFNPLKLSVATSNLEEIPSPVPETNSDGKSYLNSVVISASDYIVITSESNKPNELIDNENGLILFGWYATKDVDALTPDMSGGKMADIKFTINDGYTIDDITESDIIPVPTADCKNISGWSSGIIVINSDSIVYMADSDNPETELKTDMEYVFIYGDGESQEQTPDDNDSNNENNDNSDDKEDAEENSENTSETNPDTDNNDPTENDNDEDEDENEETEQNEIIDFEINGKEESADFSIEAEALTDSVRITWSSPENKEIHFYSIELKDLSSNIIRRVEGIVPITRSFTIKNLAPDFSCTISMSAYTIDGTKLNSTNDVTVKTEKDISATPITFEVIYDYGNGRIYGFDSEIVMFGTTPTKIPTVYPPQGYSFAGWSLDGKNVISTENLKVYSDLKLTAIYEPENT